MSKKQPLLVIWWPQTHDQQQAEEAGQLLRVRYEVIGLTGLTLSQGVEPIGRLPKDLPCLVLAHPSEVTLIAVKPPAVSGKKLKEALPFLVEPFLLNDPEENICTLWADGLAKNTQQEALAAVIAKSRVRAICQLLNAQGLQVVGISGEGLLKPAVPSAWVSAGTLWIADGIKPPMAIDTDHAIMANALLKKRTTGDSQTAISIYTKDLQLVRTKLGLSEWVGMSESNQPTRPDLYGLQARLLINGPELQRFGLKSVARRGTSTLGGLMNPAITLLVVAIVGLNALAWKTQRVEDALQAQIEETYQRALPNVPMVADPLVLIDREKRRLNAGTQTTDGTGLPYLLHQAGLALDAAPFNSLQALAWDGKVLKLTFAATVTTQIQESTIASMGSKSLKGKWLANNAGAVELEVSNTEGK